MCQVTPSGHGYGRWESADVIVVAQWFQQGFKAFFSNGVFQIVVDCGRGGLQKLAELGELLFDSNIGASAGKFVSLFVDGGKGQFELRFEFVDVAAKVVMVRSFAAGKPVEFHD